MTEWKMDYTPADPAAWGTMPPLTEETATLTIQGEHRLWQIQPRQGSLLQDHWTVIATPHPGEENAQCIEDGQFPTLQVAFRAMLEAMSTDDGSDYEDEPRTTYDLSKVVHPIIRPDEYARKHFHLIPIDAQEA